MAEMDACPPAFGYGGHPGQCLRGVSSVAVFADHNLADVVMFTTAVMRGQCRAGIFAECPIRMPQLPISAEVHSL